MDKQMHSLRIDGFKGRESPHKTWSATTAQDLKAWNIDANNAYD